MERTKIIETVLIIALFVSLIAAIFVIGYIYNDNYYREKEISQEITALALEELKTPDCTDAELTFTGHFEELPWNEWYIYIYTLKIGGKIYLVGAERKDWKLNKVKVECEIEEAHYND